MKEYFYIVDVTNDEVVHTFQSGGGGQMARLYESLESARKVAITFAKGSRYADHPYRSQHYRVFKLVGNVPICEVIAKRNTNYWNWSEDHDELFVTDLLSSPTVAEKVVEKKWWSFKRPKVRE